MSAARVLALPLVGAYTRRWPPHSRLFFVGEGVRWSIDHDMSELASLVAQLGIRVAPRWLLAASPGQAVFYGSQFTLLCEPWTQPPHRIATAYFHGRPGTPGHPEFDECFRLLARHHEKIARVQVTHDEMHELVLSSGIAEDKVFRIRIAVDLAKFRPATDERRASVRAKLDLPQTAFVVGSFQKDGVGWADGTEPKTIKGPDVLVAALRAAKNRIPDLYVLLSGPARGYVRRELERLGIPHRHVLAGRYEELSGLYGALDAYVVPARQEGGPKGVLEAMACGVPVISTRVGQASEIIRDGVNGRLVAVEDSDALADALTDPRLHDYRAPGRETAEANSYDMQLPLWREFFDGFVEA